MDKKIIDLLSKLPEMLQEHEAPLAEAAAEPSEEEALGKAIVIILSTDAEAEEEEEETEELSDDKA